MRKYLIVLIVAVAALAVVLVLQGRAPKPNDMPMTSENPHSPHGEEGMPMHPPVGDVDMASMDFSGIELPEGGTRIETLYSDRANLAYKDVVVRGKVVKFTEGVMNANWIHLRDGTGAEGTNDLTVTTQATAEVGDVVTVRGVLSIDKDFGLGYAYDVIIEDASVVVE